MGDTPQGVLECRTCRRCGLTTLGASSDPRSSRLFAERSTRVIATLEALRQAEDDAIRSVVKMQEDVGLGVVTDGEFRRLNFQDSFGASVSGFAAGRGTLEDMEAASANAKPLQRFEKTPSKSGPVVMSHRSRVDDRLRLVKNTLLEEFEFLRQVARSTAKVTLIGPDRVSQRVALEDSADIYADADELLADVIAIEGQMVAELVGAGCAYVQIDAPGYTAYVDDASLEAMGARGEDPAENMARSIAADNALLTHLEGVTSAIHLCRGNNRSMWHREGHYDAIAEELFSTLGHDRILLEYDSERAGSFEPLRFIPPDKVVVLGLVSTKTPELETVDDLQRRDRGSEPLPPGRAARDQPAVRLCLERSGQCHHRR